MLPSRNIRPRVILDSLREYNLVQMGEMLGHYNRWLTGVDLGRCPTDSECRQHFVSKKGSDDFARRYCYRIAV